MELSKGRIIWLSLLLGTLSAYGPLLMDAYLPAFPVIQEELGISASLTQMSLTMCLIGLALGPLAIGTLSDRIGRKKPLAIGITVAILCCLLVPFVRNIWLFLALRLLQGIASSAGIVLTRAIAKDLFTGERLTKFFAMLIAVNGIFPIISPLLGSAILAVASWQTIFLFLGGLGILLLLGILFGYQETLQPQEHIHQMESGWRAVLSDRIFVLLVLIQGFIYGALFSYISGSSFMFQNVYGLSDQMYSLLYGINGIGIIVTAELSGILSRRLSLVQQLGSGLVIGFIGSVLVMLSGIRNSIALAIIGLFLVVATLGIVNSVVTTLAMDRQGEHAGVASSILGIGMYSIGIICTPLVVIMGSHTYLPLALLIFLCEIGALGVYRVMKQEARP